ncbi:MAG: hypothetical protein K0Q89_2841, partial [Thermomicrobiales bacterium]|nr:hypothetical protein [Thermomicrobiales bacterium]
MPLHDLLGPGQSDAGTGDPADVAAALVALEDLRQIGGGDANPFVLHHEQRVRDGVIRHRLDPERHRPPLWAVLDRVSQQIEDHPLDASGIPQTHDRLCRGCKLHVPVSR